VVYFSKYKSLQAKLQKKFGAGGTLLGIHTLARDFRNADSQTGFQEEFSWVKYKTSQISGRRTHN
jgi:hypothetical protein